MFKYIKTVSLFIFLFVFFLPINAAKFDSKYFGGIKARMIGPATMSGRITAIDCVKGNPNIVYVGTAGGGIWKSIDKGTTFKPIFEKYTMAIGCITIDQKNPDTVWVGTGETNVRNSVSVGTGLYKTKDGGKSWKYIAVSMDLVLKKMPKYTSYNQWHNNNFYNGQKHLPEGYLNYCVSIKEG